MLDKLLSNPLSALRLERCCSMKPSNLLHEPSDTGVAVPGQEDMPPELRAAELCAQGAHLTSANSQNDVPSRESVVQTKGSWRFSYLFNAGVLWVPKETWAPSQTDTLVILSVALLTLIKDGTTPHSVDILGKTRNRGPEPFCTAHLAVEL